jgi:hypothetical protein
MRSARAGGGASLTRARRSFARLTGCKVTSAISDV